MYQKKKPPEGGFVWIGEILFFSRFMSILILCRKACPSFHKGLHGWGLGLSVLVHALANEYIKMFC